MIQKELRINPLCSEVFLAGLAMLYIMCLLQPWFRTHCMQACHCSCFYPTQHQPCCLKRLCSEGRLWCSELPWLHTKLSSLMETLYSDYREQPWVFLPFLSTYQIQASTSRGSIVITLEFRNVGVADSCFIKNHSMAFVLGLGSFPTIARKVLNILSHYALYELAF